MTRTPTITPQMVAPQPIAFMSIAPQPMALQPITRRRIGRRVAPWICLVLITLLLPACDKFHMPGMGNMFGDKKTEQPQAKPIDEKALTGTQVLAVRLDDPIVPTSSDRTIALSAAKNEWVSFAVGLSGLPRVEQSGQLGIRIKSFAGASAGTTAISPENLRAYQLLPMPVDLNRAGFVRHTGLTAAPRQLPRALLPLKIVNGNVDLSQLRDPAHPTDPASHVSEASQGPILWIDVQVPTEAAAGAYMADCQLVDLRNDAKIISSLSLQLEVYDFVIPDERHLLMVNRLDWDSLLHIYPDRFEAITARLVNRNDKRYAAAVSTLDQLIKLAHENRVDIVVPRLQPTVKWPAGSAPVVDWSDFDTVASPWLDGSAFSDRTPVGYWPLPAVDYLNNYDKLSQTQYWTAAATHFDQKEWLRRSSVFLDKPTTGMTSMVESLQLSAQAGYILNSHPGIRVTLPVMEDQLQMSSADSPALIDGQKAGRLWAAAPGLVFASPLRNWPADLPRPQRWLRTDLPGLVPYAGAGGDERDVRLWAWLAYLRQASMILWDGVLPSADNATTPADPSEMVWFYPGEWFGVDQPVPTVQLKWVRRAQQDYEYMYLARERGEQISALVMARLVTKPVEIQPSQPLDATYGLMCGTTDAKAWREVLNLMAQTVLLRKPGQSADPQRQNALYLRTLQWLEPQERPTLLARTTSWGWGLPGATPGNWIDLRLGLDIYNASDSRAAAENLIQFTSVPPGWQVRPQAMKVPSLSTYQIRQMMMDAKFNIDQASVKTTEPVEITYTDGFKKTTQVLQLALPVGVSDRREGNLHLDGSLEDWFPEDLLLDGPMVHMFSRPMVHNQKIEPASTPTQLYSTWSESNYYLGFALHGLDKTQEVHQSRNFVDYQFRRAWGEDLAEILIQPVYADGSEGPVIHMVCKPTAGQWVERMLDPKTHVDPWQPFEGTGIRYASTINADTWRGEVAIPWKAMGDQQKGRPTLLRFNFSQHKNQTGESASWAGPVDWGRDENFTGLVYLRDEQEPGMRPANK